MVSIKLKSTSSIRPKVYAQYYNISQNFHSSQVALQWLDFNLFMHEIADTAIKEALHQPKKYGADGRFFNLLRFRYTDFLRKYKAGKLTSLQENESIVELKVSSSSNTKICLDKTIGLIDDLLLQVDQFTEGQLATKFIDLAGQFNITHFLGIKINEVDAICKMQTKTRQNRCDHRKKFKTLIANITTKSHTTIELDETKDYSGIKKEAIKYFEQGLQNRCAAKEFENNSRLKVDITSFFKCFLCYLKASFYFKKANEIDASFYVNRYNYAYVLKRLGFFTDAVIELKELVSEELPTSKKAMILECLGDTFLLSEEFDKAINYFEAALKFLPQDVETLFNLLNAYYQNKNESKIESILTSIIKLNKAISNQSHLMLLKQIAKTSNSNIIQLTSLIIKIK